MNAVVLSLDEWIIKQYFMGRFMRWPLLQQSLFNVGNGGRLFYRTLDKLLKVQGQEIFIYQTYYFLLKEGFCGMYMDEQITRQHHLNTLETILCR